VRNGFSSVDCSHMRLELVSPGGESRGKLKKNPIGHTLSIIESACAETSQNIFLTQNIQIIEEKRWRKQLELTKRPIEDFANKLASYR